MNERQEFDKILLASNINPKVDTKILVSGIIKDTNPFDLDAEIEASKRDEYKINYFIDYFKGVLNELEAKHSIKAKVKVEDDLMLVVDALGSEIQPDYIKYFEECKNAHKTLDLSFALNYIDSYNEYSTTAEMHSQLVDVFNVYISLLYAELDLKKEKFELLKTIDIERKKTGRIGRFGVWALGGLLFIAPLALSSESGPDGTFDNTVLELATEEDDSALGDGSKAGLAGLSLVAYATAASRLQKPATNIVAHIRAKNMPN